MIYTDKSLIQVCSFLPNNIAVMKVHDTKKEQQTILNIILRYTITNIKTVAGMDARAYIIEGMPS